ncbi:hypothetical protein HZS_666 [Henneguya salminicola]|nr:hypothetical protein HZS_666 [Henneguya salminicola]
MGDLFCFLHENNLISIISWRYVGVSPTKPHTNLFPLGTPYHMGIGSREYIIGGN